MPDQILEPRWQVWTAIANSDAESFVAGTLHEYHFEIKYRCFNFAELSARLAVESEANQLILISDDLVDFDLAAMERLRAQGLRTLLLSKSELASNSDLRNNSVELVRRIRELIKSPSTSEKGARFTPNPRCQIIGVISHSGGVGSTSIAINLAMELSIVGKQTLLVDGDLSHPTIAELLHVRSYTGELQPQPLKENLRFLEIESAPESDFIPAIQRAVDTSDFLVIDLGKCILNVATPLQELVLDFADRILIISTNSRIHQQRCKNLVSDLKARALPGSPHLLINLVSGKLGVGELAREERLFAQIQERGLVAVEVNPRSKWRKEVERIAIQLIS